MNWKFFKEYFPYLSVLVILLSLFVEMTYYQNYHIDIQNYLSPTELLLMAVQELGSIFFITFITGLLTVMFLNDWEFKLQQALQNSSTANRIKIFKTELVGFGATVVMCAVAYWIQSPYKMPFLIFTFGVPFYSMIFFEISLSKRKQGDEFKAQYFHFLFLILLVIIFIGYFADIDIEKTEKGQYFGTRIYTKDSTYISDSTHFFIGKTTNFYFIFNNDKKCATIIPEREVSRFELHKLP